MFKRLLSITDVFSIFIPVLLREISDFPSDRANNQGIPSLSAFCVRNDQCPKSYEFFSILPHAKRFVHTLLQKNFIFDPKNPPFDKILQRNS